MNMKNDLISKCHSKKRSHQNNRSQQQINKKKRKKFHFPIHIYKSNDYEHYDFTELSSSYPPFAHQLNQLKLRRELSASNASDGTREKTETTNEILQEHHEEKSKNETANDESIEDDNLNTFSCFGTFVTFDFNLELARAILHKYHGGITLTSMPKGRLCPPIPNRLNYVRWIYDLVYQNTEFGGDEKIQKIRENENKLEKLHFRGIDIGTGASCIYPLLLSSTFSKEWAFFATEIDPISFHAAQSNIDANKLQQQIQIALVLQTEEKEESKPAQELQSNKAQLPFISSPLSKCKLNKVKGPVYNAIEAAIKLYNEPKIQFDFCMTNPPFYSNATHCQAPRSGDLRTRTSMTSSESFYPRGGEKAFILDMINDSLILRKKITWYTSLIGQKSTLDYIEKILLKFGFSRGNVRIAEFVQGKRGIQRRWAIAWTFVETPLRSLALKLNDNSLKLFEVNFPAEDNNEKSVFDSNNNVKIEQVTNGTNTINETYNTQNTIKSYQAILRQIVAQRIHDYCQLVQKDIGIELEVTIHEDKSHQALQIQQMHASILSQHIDITNDMTFVSITGMPVSMNLETNQGILNQNIQNIESEAKHNCNDDDLNTIESTVRSTSSSEQKKGKKLKLIKQYTIGQKTIFLIDAIIQNKCLFSSKDNNQDDEKTSNTDNIVAVTLHCFSQTQQGDIIIERIKCQMEGEIQRSNRRWRRIFSKKNKTAIENKPD